MTLNQKAMWTLLLIVAAIVFLVNVVPAQVTNIVAAIEVTEVRTNDYRRGVFFDDTGTNYLVTAPQLVTNTILRAQGLQGITKTEFGQPSTNWCEWKLTQIGPGYGLGPGPAFTPVPPPPLPR
jgi:hypothetical protein